MNASSMGGGGFRREDGGRGKRGGERRQGSNSFMDNQWKTSRSNYIVDTSKFKAVTQKVNSLMIYIHKTSRLILNVSDEYFLRCNSCEHYTICTILHWLMAEIYYLH